MEAPIKTISGRYHGANRRCVIQHDVHPSSQSTYHNGYTICPTSLTRMHCEI